MNGIIHTCSNINEDNCETHVTEEEIFRNIFHYLDVSLFIDGMKEEIIEILPSFFFE